MFTSQSSVPGQSRRTPARQALLLLLGIGVLQNGEVAAAPGAVEATARRFALLASSNDGGPDRATLRYADSDAQAMAEVLRHLGGVQDRDLVVLPHARRSALEHSFGRLRALVAGTRSDGLRREVFVYYSGHSDEEGLLLAGERVSYPELRHWIDGVGADVRIVILDSCASGALLRPKGIKKSVPTFLQDRSSDARGHAFLAASSADEAAQESDRIGAAFFTHYLISGLRGAADRTRDGQITLAEAYQFAYHETLRRTERTTAGAQHPTYDFQLAGKGELVLTDLGSTSASLILEDEIAGRVYVRNRSGRLMAELRKEPPYPIQLGLGPGEYHVLVDDDGRLREAVVTLGDGQSKKLGISHFTPVQSQIAATRGDANPPDPAPPKEKTLVRTLIGEATLVGQTRQIGGYAGLAPRYTRLGSTDGFIMNLEAAVLLNRQVAIGLTAGGGISADRAGQGTGLSMGYAALLLRYHFLCDISSFCFSLGAAAGAGGVDDNDEDGPEANDSSGDAIFVFEPQLAGHLNITRFFRVGVDLGYRMIAGAELYPTKDVRGPTAGFHAQLGWF